MKYHYLIKVIVCLVYLLIRYQSATAVSTASNKPAIPALNPQFSPLAKENHLLLFKRIVATFDSKYRIHEFKNRHKNLADNSVVYYLRRELQALIDMWRATGNLSYLDRAEKLTIKAITDAQKNQRMLLWHNHKRGIWPCFFAKSIEKITGGHGQLNDFQGSAGFMMVANALNQARRPGWEKIADFVETKIITKWLFRDPNMTFEKLTGPKSEMYLLAALDGARDKREHFATICMNLDKLGYKKYPYKQWAKFLTDVYLGDRTSLAQPYPRASELGNVIPKNWDWGVIPNKKTGGFLWYWTKNNVVPDTSHANRTVWLATKAYQENLIDREKLDGFINTFKHQVWAPDKKPFHFNNFIDGSDKIIGRMGPGKKGNVWFGWNRLAAYDETLKGLFISIAYDLTNGGPNVIGQNKGMENAPLCFYAWAARLLASDGKPHIFP